MQIINNDDKLTSAMSCRPDTLVLHSRFFNNPKQRSHENFVWPEMRKFSSISSCSPIIIRQHKYCNMQLFLFCPLQKYFSAHPKFRYQQGFYQLLKWLPKKKKKWKQVFGVLIYFWE